MAATTPPIIAANRTVDACPGADDVIGAGLLEQP